MFRKKTVFSLLAAALLLTGVVSTPATASAHHRSHRSRSYPVCTVEDCTKTGNHKHHGKTYCAHYYNDGHDYCAQTTGGHHGGCH